MQRSRQTGRKQRAAAWPGPWSVQYGRLWPSDQPFPLTPLEAWYVRQGWEVAPAAETTLKQALPGKVEAGWVRLWHA